MSTSRHSFRYLPVAACCTFIVSIAVLSLAACVPDAADSSARPAGAAPDRGRALQAHTRFLAHDLLGGRGTGTAGFDIAAEYVAAHFALAGLEPMGDGGTYFQQVPLRRHSLEPNGVSFHLQIDGRLLPFENGVDIAVGASPRQLRDTLDADLVFVGWGISAPELGIDDYRDLDVQGKAVVLLEGAPSDLPGAIRAHFSWIHQKERMAAARGAVAVLTLKTPTRERIVSWERTRALRPLPAVSWVRDDAGEESRAIQATISLGPRAGQALFAAAGHDFQAMLVAAEKQAPRGFPLPARVRMQRRSIHEPVSSANVVARLPGSDPELRDEHILVVSHLDHVGMGPPVDGDAIYNGAIDNAGGIAVMLEVARALAADRPRRSVLFVATTGEEMGLIGSEYFAAHPVVPLEHIVAAISVDGLMAFNDFTGIVALGAEHSRLGEFSAAAAEAVGAKHVPDPIPERGNLALSDQYPFLRRGIPVLFPNPARDTGGADPEGEAAWDAYVTRHYHQPTDDITLPIRWDSAARWLAYIEEVIKRAANDRRAIEWHDGDVLGRLFRRK